MASKETSGDASGSSLLLNQPVVIDNGTATLKAGFAGTSKPKASVQYDCERCYAEDFCLRSMKSISTHRLLFSNAYCIVSSGVPVIFRSYSIFLIVVSARFLSGDVCNYIYKK